MDILTYSNQIANWLNSKMKSSLANFLVALFFAVSLNGIVMGEYIAIAIGT